MIRKSRSLILIMTGALAGLVLTGSLALAALPSRAVAPGQAAGAIADQSVSVAHYASEAGPVAVAQPAVFIGPVRQGASAAVPRRGEKERARDSAHRDGQDDDHHEETGH